MLSLFEGANGVKTGYTKASGRCLVSGAERGGMQLICVVLNEGDMWGRSMELLSSAFEKYSLRAVLDGEPFVLNSRSVTTKPRYYPLTEKEIKDLKVEYTVTSAKKGCQEVGFATVKLGDRLIFCEKVYTI